MIVRFVGKIGDATKEIGGSDRVTNDAGMFADWDIVAPVGSVVFLFGSVMFGGEEVGASFFDEELSEFEVALLAGCSPEFHQS